MIVQEGPEKKLRCPLPLLHVYPPPRGMNGLKQLPRTFYALIGTASNVLRFTRLRIVLLMVRLPVIAMLVTWSLLSPIPRG